MLHEVGTPVHVAVCVIWQFVPVYPGEHAHVYDPAEFVHTPPFWQTGLGAAHSSMSVVQPGPVYPAGHTGATAQVGPV
jgi:hypothetical protein